MECQKCKLWDIAAKEAGKAGGMCEECFDKGYVHFKTIIINANEIPKIEMPIDRDILTKYKWASIENVSDEINAKDKE